VLATVPTRPPSTSQTAPLTYAPARLAKKSVAPAISFRLSVPLYPDTCSKNKPGSSPPVGAGRCPLVHPDRVSPLEQDLSSFLRLCKRVQHVPEPDNLPLGHTPGASTLLRIPHGASMFAKSLPRCVQACFARVYDMDRTLGSKRNAPDEDTERTWEVWYGGREIPGREVEANRCCRTFPWCKSSRNATVV